MDAPGAGISVPAENTIIPCVKHFLGLSRSMESLAVETSLILQNGIRTAFEKTLAGCKYTHK